MVNNYPNTNLLSNYIGNLILHKYTTFQSRISVYAYKGILGRISPIVVHFSMILILAGASIGFFGGFVAQELVPKGEFFHIQNTIGAGTFSRIPQDVFYQVNNFWIDYNTDNSIQQFYSEINVYDKTLNVSKTEIISVNHPITYKGIVIYQTDWEITGIRIQIDDKKIQIPAQSRITPNKEKIWICSIYTDTKNRINFLIKRLDNTIQIYDDKGHMLQEVNTQKEHVLYINDKQMRILDILTSSGLQIKKDNGIPIVYLGFLILMTSTIVSYVSFTQVWFSKYNNKILSQITTNRSVLEIESELKEMIIHSNSIQLASKI